MEQEKGLDIAIKFADIDNMPLAEGQEGWVSSFSGLLEQTLAFYFNRPPAIHFLKATEPVDEQAFNTYGAIIYVLSPAFIFSSNINADISLIEKACFFDTNHINAKIYKVLKGPVQEEQLPVTISMGRYYYFYQTASLSDSHYETLFSRDSSSLVHERYWDSLTSLIFDLLKQLGHQKHQRFLPPNEQTVYVSKGGLDQLWNRNRLLGELNARGITILPDHDHSVEVKHLKEPAKFYLKESRLAIYFPEEFIPFNEKSLQELTDLHDLKRLIWFDPEAEKDLEKKKQYDELKLQLKNLEHVEAISAGIEELKEIVFAATDNYSGAPENPDEDSRPGLYLIGADDMEKHAGILLPGLLKDLHVRLLLPGQESGQEKRTKHYQFLKEAGYALIWYNGHKPEWIRANINEVKKAAGLHTANKGHIRLGVVCSSLAVRDELAANVPVDFSLMVAGSPLLAEELNDFVHGK